MPPGSATGTCTNLQWPRWFLSRLSPTHCCWCIHQWYAVGCWLDSVRLHSSDISTIPDSALMKQLWSWRSLASDFLWSYWLFNSGSAYLHLYSVRLGLFSVWPHLCIFARFFMSWILPHQTWSIATFSFLITFFPYGKATGGKLCECFARPRVIHVEDAPLYAWTLPSDALMTSITW